MTSDPQEDDWDEWTCVCGGTGHGKGRCSECARLWREQNDD